MATESQPTIFRFPVELAQDILSFCHPWDVAAFSQTCRAAYSLIYQPADQYLWHQLYIAYSFDPPQFPDLACANGKINWKNELTDRMRVELALFCGPPNVSERQHVLRMLITIIEDSSSAVSRTGSSRNIGWLKRVMRQSLVLHNLYSDPEVEDDVQLHAQLRAYLALTIIDSKHDKKTLAKLLDRRDLSRAFVYNLLHYEEENRWGPFMPDGRVNWIHVEHLVVVVALNIRELPGSWALTRPPTCLDSPRLSSRTFGKDPSNDWAGVEGTWRRYVCFMDYRY
ncbi:hypothetical protein GALMADRAFT_234061 [Galerina marginata CBS 339.88]|uniref:F-box domain-containing protein n=1 Tax=Galerina marginata (strain CBS 339.88) TaxID=685588 RepID=A0A067TSJ1_GALM3|nr:hypothetical protein GALMADRAFT_234061 [Galerina marginata CBS 339.88]